jgi:hypothetical protein
LGRRGQPCLPCARTPVTRCVVCIAVVVYALSRSAGEWGVDHYIVFPDISKPWQCPVAACEFAPKGETIVSASSDRTLKIWDVASGTCRWKATGAFFDLFHCVGKTVGSNVFAYALSPISGERRRAVTSKTDICEKMAAVPSPVSSSTRRMRGSSSLGRGTRPSNCGAWHTANATRLSPR